MEKFNMVVVVNLLFYGLLVRDSAGEELIVTDTLG